MCGRPEKPPAAIARRRGRGPGRGRSASIERARTASARRAAASAGGRGVDGQDLELLEELLEGRERRRVELVRDARELARRTSGTRARARAGRRLGADASADELQRPRGEVPGAPRRREAPRPPFGALGLLALAGLVRVAAALVGPCELGDQPVERGRWRRAPQPICASRKARAAAPACPARRRPRRRSALERQRSRGEGLPQDVGLEAAADPVEKGQSRLPGSA